MLTQLQLGRFSVVLVATRNPLNIGAAARAMSNFGILDLRVVRPYEPAFRDARSAVGAAALLESARMYDHVADAIADASLVIGTSAGARRETDHPVYRLEAAAPLVSKHLTESHLEQDRVALLFGSEKFGLSNEDLSHCDWLLHIPTREQHLSMNLGQAVAVCLYELVRRESSAEAATPIKMPLDGTEKATPKATMEERERVASVLMESLATSGYMEKHQQTDLHAQVRRMIARMEFNTTDAQALLGMLRQALWKMRSTRNE